MYTAKESHQTTELQKKGARDKKNKEHFYIQVLIPAQYFIFNTFHLLLWCERERSGCTEDQEGSFQHR